MHPVQGVETSTRSDSQVRGSRVVKSQVAQKSQVLGDLNFFEEMGLIQSRESLLKETMGAENYAVFQRIQVLARQRGVMARVPYELEIQ